MLDELLKEGKINKDQYDTYRVFAIDETGASLLKSWTNAFMKESIEPKSDLCVFVEGKRSVLKEIHSVIDFVDEQLEMRRLGNE